VRDLSAIKHIVWDWNGTLLDDNEAVIKSVNGVFAEFGKPSMTMAQWRDKYRRPLRAVYEELLETHIDAVGWARLDELYHASYQGILTKWLAEATASGNVSKQPEHGIGIAEGAISFLDSWRSSGRQQSLLSMWGHHELVPTVSALNLDHYMTRVDGLRKDAGGQGKAESMAAHLAAQSLDPATVLVIGDVEDDATAAESVGANVLLVASGASSHARLAATGHPVISSLVELATERGGE
jgi:phosphoglycolate phosphatase-like HAD superfamily hydrolase